MKTMGPKKAEGRGADRGADREAEEDSLSQATHFS
jgi:hypothetical protein